MMRRMARTAATTAVVVGTAGAVAGHQQKKAAQKQAGAQQQAAQQQATTEQQMADQQVAAPTPGVMTDAKIAQLQKMGELKAAGILTEEEFAAEKAKILAS
jgi:hypothetical protein